jgi:hypothetical protein
MACASAAAVVLSILIIILLLKYKKNSRWSLGEITDRAPPIVSSFVSKRARTGHSGCKTRLLRIVGKCDEEIANHSLTRVFCIRRVPLVFIASIISRFYTNKLMKTMSK